MIFNRFDTKHAKRSPASKLALAIALASGTALTATALEVPAHAQKKRQKGDEQAAAAQYSDAFRETFGPYQELANSETADVAALRAAVDPVRASISTPDDRYVGGNFLYNTGVKAQDPALQLEGIRLMLESGKTPAANLGQYNFVAAQLSYQQEQWADARQFLEAAIANGYTQNNPRALIIESYIKEGNSAEAVNYITRAADEAMAAGQKPERSWLVRGIQQAYQSEMREEAKNLSYLYAMNYPSPESWGDAIVIARAFGSNDDQTSLDFLRLQRRTDTFRQANDYIDYIEFADARRLPYEVKAIIDEGYASGTLPRDNSYVTESYGLAKQRIAADQADLGSLERDARASGASLSTVMAAGDVFLSYDQPAKAEEFYRAALDKSGADRGMVLTRLGIAQVDQGKYDEAQQTFEQVQGARSDLANLWSAYAKQQAEGTTMTPAA
ncbi:tetratricopeptide repeat protein [Altererythrobacter aurantiacus]|uniref:Tetratricopeptide repeat protein n=1 Tax=Parapontixanthobacter aurantiacus TaxID=1463599 RepID=A0A844ZBQ7_9SPHN|nr:tetratricopeptide repeat protein [Parapontixanthobacter aurantiacus]MXO85345.1 tetratricopeptide repeat protein [Parapontixanthobacter aurantiacus]